jgi:hypothetical protein
VVLLQRLTCIIHLVLDEGYCPSNDVDVAVFKKMQTFMYAVLQTHLQTDKGKSLVSQFEATRDAQSIYQELVKHALSSTAAQLSGDTLLQYITTTRYPGTWRGISHGFALHWKEQVMKYKKLEVEALLQNAVDNTTELSYIKQIGDQDVARGHPALAYDSYMELLLSACSPYDKKLRLPGKQKRAVYQTEIDKHDNTDYPFDDTYDGGYEAYCADMDILEIMANVGNINRYGSTSNLGKTHLIFLPRNEWDKLTQERKDWLIAKRQQEQMNQNDYKPKSSQATCQANTHCVADTVNIDDIIDYAVNNHERGTTDPDDILKESDSDNTVLAHMSENTSSSGDICQVLAANQKVR